MLRQTFMDRVVGETIKEICNMEDFVLIIFEDSFIYIRPYIDEDGDIVLRDIEFNIDGISNIRLIQEICNFGIITQAEADEAIKRKKLGYEFQDIAAFKQAVRAIGWEKAREILGEM